MTKIMHVITTLGPAGAETMLCGIVNAMDSKLFENEVVSLTGILDQAHKMEGIGVRVRTLDMGRSMPNPLLVFRLAKWIRESKPEIIHTWMYHANLVGGLAARLAGNVPVIWAIHHSTLDPRVDKRRTMLVNCACAYLSRKLPDRIVCCSQASLRFHKKLGYAPGKLEVIPNGFDLQHLKPDSGARSSLREELDIASNSLLIGMAARFHPHKGHRNFVQAAQRLHKQFPEIHFLLCGLNVTWENAQLVSWIEAAGLREHCHLLGVRQDMPRLFAGMDIATNASSTEAFPIVVGEAMACGTPCVVTDVGDSAMIVDQSGIVVPPENSHALAHAWQTLIQAGPEVRHGLGMAARHRVELLFSLPAIVARYQTIYEDLATRPRQAVSSPTISQCA